MTNGEKLKEVFPNMRIDVFVSYVQVVGENYEFNNLYPLKWWNAEYKEPTTKNDLGVDAVSRQAINGYIDYILSHGMGKRKSFEFIKNFVANLPSVTPQEPILDQISEIIEPLRHLPIGEMSDIEWDILRVIDKYKGESEG